MLAPRHLIVAQDMLGSYHDVLAVCLSHGSCRRLAIPFSVMFIRFSCFSLSFRRWNRSKLDDESPGNSSKDSSPDSTSSKSDGDEQPYGGNDQLDSMDEGSSLDPNFLEAKELKQTFQQSLVRGIPSQSVSNVGGVLPGRSRIMNEPPTISTYNAMRRPSIECNPCEVKPVLPEMRQGHVIVDEPAVEELGPDLHGRAQQQELDVRASAVLERCRRLLEVPTAVS